MGRAMLIICSAALISLGIIGISTSKTGSLLSQSNVNYAYETTVKNAAHTGIQIAMQKISEDENDTDWIKTYDATNPFKPNINKPVDSLYIYAECINDCENNDYFDNDTVRIVGKASILHGSKATSAKISSVYKMRKFASLVPDFMGALQLPSGYGSLNADGTAHDINGVPPSESNCPESKAPVAVNSQSTKDDLATKDLNMDGDILVDESLDYEPTDDLIKRLEDYATIVNSDFGSTLGTADDPGVFFVEGDVKLSGDQKEGYGILVIRGGSGFEMEDPDLSVAGNFTFNGLVIFENAELFDGRGTPTINGSVLVGDTEGATDINVDIGGNITINYDCAGEKYAKIAANNLVDQNKYNRIVSYEGISIDE